MSRHRLEERTCSLLAIVAVLVTGPAAHAAGDNPPGAPPTTLLTSDVTARTGAFSHTLPIALPPARRGTAPSLALVYGSGNDNGLAGVGWNLQGLPAIVRVSDDNGMRFDGLDTYAFAGAGWSGALPGPEDYLVSKGDNHYHRARNEAGTAMGEFAWDTTSAACGDQQLINTAPCGWILRDQGFVYKFGTVANARLLEPPNGVTSGRGIAVWALYQVVDPDGNYWQATYANTGATLYPIQVEYNLPRAGATPRSLRVDFDYNARTDLTPAPFRFPVVLSRIRVNGHCTATGCSLVRQYQLGHTASPVSGRRLLTSFQETGGDLATSLPAQTFAYTSGGGAPTGVFDSTNGFTDIAQCEAFRSSGAACAWQTHTGDIDGDGKDDVVRFFAGGTGANNATRTFLVEYTCGRTDGLTGTRYALSTATLANYADGQGVRPPIDGWRSVLTDVNGDGKKDLVVVNPTATPTTAEQQALVTGVHLWSVALGGVNGAPCSLSGLQSVSREQVRGEPFSSGQQGIVSWSILPTDGDGRGQGGVVMIDHAMNRVHEKASTGSNLGQAIISNYGNTTCTFQQWQSGDVNGDGRQDIDAFAHAGNQMCLMTSSAGGTGTGANYTAFATTVQAIAPAANLDYDVVRPGDLNGDGRTDFVFSYQGAVRNGIGRDLRYWLGSTSSGANPIRLLAQDGVAYPGASLAANHLNEWEYLVGDVTGDGLDDYLQVYLGSSGVRINQAISTPTGPGALVAHTNASGAMPDNANNYAFNKWHAALADLNGDGLKDLVYAKYANLIAPNATVMVAYYVGTPTGLSPTVSFLTNYANDTGGDSRNVSLRIADVNGDGKDDVLLANDNIADPRTTSAKIAYAVGPRNAPFASSVQDAPDLLRTIDNGQRAVRTIEYRLAGDFAGAVAPAALGCNGAGEAPAAGHWATGASCGIALAKPRPLVARIVDDDGRGFVTSTAYDYYNGRVNLGRRSARVDLGFGWVRQTNEQSTAFEQTYFRQQAPYQAMVRERHVHGGDAAHTRMSKAYLQYATTVPFAGVTIVQRIREDHAIYNRAAIAAASTAARSYAYDPSYGMLTRATEADTAAAYEGVSEYGYRAPDLANWTVGRLDSVRIKGTDPAAPTGSRVLTMRRLLYDEASSHPWRLARLDELQFNRFDEASCASYGDPWLASTCQAEITAKLAHWVTIAQGFVYDAYGNLTSVDGVRSQNPDLSWNNRRLRVDYDGTYVAHPTRQTNDLGHVVTRAYDLAGRVVATTDANNQTTSMTYDALGRVTAILKPGQAGVGRLFQYLQLGDPANQRTEVRTSTGAGASAVTAYYLNGRGEPWKVVEHAPIGDIQHLRSRAYVAGTLRERVSEPHFTSASPQYLERRFDFAGRPVGMFRTDASFATLGRLFEFAYQDDGGVTITDAKGASNRVYRNARGLTTRVTDAAGNDTRTFYNAAWLPSRVTLPGGAAIDLQYDGRFRPYSINDPTASGFRRFVVDDPGNLVLVLNLPTPTSPSSAATSRIRYAYDALDRRNAEIEIDASGSETTRVTYGYDEAFATNGKGRLTSAIDTSGLQTFAYDPRGNLSQRLHLLSGLPGTYTYAYTYNDRDQLTSRTFPSGGPWSGTDQGTETYYYAADGMLTDIYRGTTPWAKWSGWNAHRKPAMAYRHWNGFEWAHMTEYGYDPDQRLAAMTTWTADGEIVLDNLYSYDAVGNLITIDDRRTSTLQGSIQTDATQGFQYDALNRVVRATDNLGPAQTYGYDALGNMVDDSGSTTTAVACGTQTCLENRTGATLNWRTYQDSEGKRTRFDDLALNASYFYAYDYRGRLSSVVKDGFTKETYAYDFAGRRTHETFLHPGNAYTTTTWQVGDSYAVRAASDAPTRYARTIDIGGVAHWTTGDLIRGQVTEATVLAQRTGAYSGAAYYGPAQGTYIDVPDHKGTPALTTHPDGSLVNRHWLDAWGNPRAASGTGFAPATVDRYNAFATSDYSRLLYAGSRYYHPKTRRFLTPDDRIVAGGAQGWNRYTYATNNPASMRENGHEGEAVAQATPGWSGADVFTALGWAQSGLLSAALVADLVQTTNAANPYSLGIGVLTLTGVAAIPGVQPQEFSRYFGAITLGASLGGESPVLGTGGLFAKLALGEATYGMSEFGATMFEFGTGGRLIAGMGTMFMLTSVLTINIQLAYLTYQAMTMTPTQALRDFESRHGPIPIDPNIVLKPDGGWRWKNQADRDAEERVNAQHNGGYPVEPGADTDTGGDFGGAGAGGDGTGGTWYGDGDGAGTPSHEPVADIQVGDFECQGAADGC